MTDIWSPAKRSEVMSRIKGRNTKPEKMLRSLLHQCGYRFTVNGPRNKKLPGHPDLVLPKHKLAVFVHGCFWHGHDGCRDFRIPSTRREWWKAKIEGNKARDQKNQILLQEAGWRVLIVWACQLATMEARNRFQKLAPTLVEGNFPRGECPEPLEETLRVAETEE